MQWRRFFRGLKQRRELVAQRLYTAGAHSYGDVDDSNMAASKQDDAPSPSASYTEKAGAPVKNHLASKDCSIRPPSAKPPASAAGRDEAQAQQSMEAKLASTKRRLHEAYKEHMDAKRQRMIQVVEAPLPQMAR
jgi:hypothetical protein